MLLAACPAVIAAVAITAQRPVIYFDGDQAKDELAVINAGHLAQLVGNNSRFAWSHPGPAWYYSLEVFYRALGGQSWAFVAANLLLNAIAIALVVAVLWRGWGSLMALFCAGAVLAYMALLGQQLFRYVWPPYAEVLPMLLFFVVAAAGAAGSSPAMVGALVAGSYAVQLHIGTVPTVAAVIGAALALRLGARYFPSWVASGPLKSRNRSPWARPLVWGGILLIVLMWIPPVIDELTGHPGNLTLLWMFFTQDSPKHDYVQALSVLGRLLTPLEWPRVGGLQIPDVSRIAAVFVAVAIAFEVLALGLVAAATKMRDRFAQAVGVVVVVACAAITGSIHDINGPVYAYLLLWVTCLPVVLGLGWIGLIPRLLARVANPIPERLRPTGTVALVALVTALSVANALGFLALPPVPNAAPDSQQAWQLTSAALAGAPRGPVLLDMNTPDAWVVTMGVALELVKDGRHVSVRDNWLFLFGKQFRTTGTEPIDLAYVDLPDSTTYASQHPVAVLIGETGSHAIFMTVAQ